jgi:hypothetical protein
VEELFCVQLALPCREPSASRTSACGLRSVVAPEPRTGRPILLANKLSHVIARDTVARCVARRVMTAESLEPFDRRDPIESACNQIRSATEEAYFYAGLAFGVTMTSSV